MRSELSFIFVLFVLFSVRTSAQDLEGGSRLVVLETNWPAAIVEADGIALGPAMMGSFSVPKNTDRIRLIPPTGGGWAIIPVEKVISGIPGDSIHVALSFPYYYKFESAPFAAQVILDDTHNGTFLGTTPFIFQSDVPLLYDVEYQLSGFMSEAVSPGDAIWNRYLIDLAPLDAQANLGEIAWTGQKKHRWWIDAAALTASATAGALAVHYKSKANSRFDDFQRTGNPDLRPRIERLDTYSGVALGFMQAGITVFAVRLVLR